MGFDPKEAVRLPAGCKLLSHSVCGCGWGPLPAGGGLQSCPQISCSTAARRRGLSDVRSPLNNRAQGGSLTEAWGGTQNPPPHLQCLPCAGWLLSTGHVQEVTGYPH